MPSVLSVHRVYLPCTPLTAGAWLDALGSEHDKIWPSQGWPPMRVAGPLAVGAVGSHGPVTYHVVDYVPGLRLCFRFLRPVGFRGSHTFEIRPEGDGCIFEHRVEISTSGWAILGWPLVFGPLHDALARDAGARAQVAAGLVPTGSPWSAYVRLLRAAARFATTA